MRKKYKTKFPVARIKKIMQMDEDVGKVAQATPILISKALELFMQSLIDEACMETRAKNAKRLTAAHLKKTILDKDQFDFLRDIVQNVADPQGSSGAGAGAGGASSGASGRAGDEGHSNGNGSASSSSSSGRQHKLSTGSSSSMKMEEDDDYDEEQEEEEQDKSYADFAGAMAAARRGAPVKATKASALGLKKGSKAPPAKPVAVKEEDDDDYDNE